ncbi:MAG TPA: DUF4387 domain-containing protein, partial [Acidimicrobiia bacterium]|nr:DUF4387 domain-containing protein [Acidimicrobiia bacterium]
VSAAPSVRLRDVASLIRSKNAGPFQLTIDVFFPDAERADAVLAAGVVAPAVIAELYSVDPADVRIIPVVQARAIKITVPRPQPAGDVGECDVAGGQQFAPLLDLLVPVEGERAP